MTPTPQADTSATATVSTASGQAVGADSAGTPVTPAAAQVQESVGSVLRQLGPAGPLAVAATVLPPIGGFALLALLGVAGPWLAGHQEVGKLLYVAGFILLSGLALLPTYAQAALGGYAFGLAWGYPLAMIGFVGGAALGYFVGWRTSGTRVTQLIDRHPKLAAVYQALLGSGFWKTLGIITLWRLHSPFALTNFALGATRTNLVAYVVGTLVGLTPRTLAAVYIAAQFQDFTARPKWLTISSIAVAVIVVFVLGHIAQKAIERVTQTEAPARR